MSITPCPHLLTFQQHLELRHHRVKASADSLFQGSSTGWIQTKSVLAQIITLGFLGQMAFLEASQDMEGTLAKERPHIRTQGAHFPPGTIQEIATAMKADHLAILDTR